jgi:hypothetical protein
MKNNGRKIPGKNSGDLFLVRRIFEKEKGV